MQGLKDNDILLKMKEQLVQEEVKVEVKDIENKIKQIKIEVNTNNKINQTKSKNDILKENVNKINIENKQPIREIRPIDVRRSDVLYVTLDEGVGSEQSGTRYCVCLQNDVGNRYSPTTIVAFFTSQTTKAKLPTHIEIEAGKYGLPKDSVLMLEQIRTIDKKRIIRKTGHIDDVMMRKINKAKEIATSELEPKKPIDRLSEQPRNKINNLLERICNCEKVIAQSKTKSLINHLLSERGDLLYLLQIFCEDNGLNYRDYYVMYKKEKEVIAM